MEWVRMNFSVDKVLVTFIGCARFDEDDVHIITHLPHNTFHFKSIRKVRHTLEKEG